LQVSLITNPIWVVKTRLQLQRGRALKAAGMAKAGMASAGSKVPMVQYTGFVDGVCRIAQEEGIRGLYRGLGPSLLMVNTCLFA
jgi:solute carrier family 25 folate transporter 32